MNKKGFTLIEMVTVMAIIGIVSVTAITGYAYSERQEMQRFAQQIGETIQVMQQKASMENAVYALYEKEQNKEKYICVECDTESIFMYKVPKQLEVKIGTEINEAIDGKQIKFAQDMSPAQAGTLWIKHQSLPYRMKLTVRPVTGIVTLYPLEEI